ncbi:MAG TPA: mechanosensitive ion channel domain-containing protein [Vicinamibacterales bacterium]|nr:mechanosensitive ion channel domain-containing protein [Vicinamibacterales bacterium]
MSSLWDQLVAHLGASALMAAGTALALIALGHAALHWWVRRRARHDAAATAAASPLRRWLTRGLQHVVSPVALLIWIQGLDFTLTLVVRRIVPPAASASTLVALHLVYGAAVVAAIVWLLSRIGQLIEAFLTSLPARTASSWDDILLPLAGKAVRLALPLLALILGAPALSVSPALAEVVRNATSLALIAVVALVLFQVVDAAAAFVLERHRIDVSDNLEARSIYTQVVVLKKVAMTVIGIFTLASMLMVFQPVRQFGASILASAGIAGIVIGFAAQRSIATLLAGFQIALTQPIRIDDVVIVENEWGRIEDITLTYVVVRIWDLRRLVVPITCFIEKPFQNWTRTSADLLGTVFLYVDYTVPVDAVRAELTRILKASQRWDGKVDVLQVTDAREHTVELRALASAADASLAWDLRCEVREKLIGFIQQQYPDCLPRLRASFDAPLAAR